MKARLVRRLALALVAVVVVFGLIPAAILGSSLVRAHRSLQAANSAIRADDLVLARDLVARAVSAASSAESVTRSPLLGGLATVVGLETDLSALGVLAEVLRDGALAGEAVLREAGAGDASSDGLAETLYRDGQIQLASVHGLHAAAASAGDVLERSERELRSAPEPVLGLVDDALERARAEIADTNRSVRKATSLLGLLPGLAGEVGTRRYLLAFQSPSEARGGGGLIGVYGILAARDGRLSLERVGPIEELVTLQEGSVEAPTWFEDLYGGLLGTREFRFANQSPYFPTTAQVWLRMYHRTTGIRLDGVIALDPFALGELTRGTGPLSAEGWDREITRTNVRRVLLHDVYRHFDLKERIQNEYLRGLIDELWERLESSDLRVGALLRGVGEAAAKQRIKIFSVDPEEEARLSELDVAGDYTVAGPAVQLLFHNNFAANKVDYFLHRTTRTTVSLREDGSGKVDVEVALDNQAPTEAGSVLVRPLRDDLISGINNMILYLLMPRGATATDLRVDGTETNILGGREGSFPVAGQLVEIGPQEAAAVRLNYRWPGAVADDGSFELTLWPQATARPDSYELTVRAPAGHLLVGSQGRREASVTLEGLLKEPLTVSLRVVPAEQG